MKPNTYLALTGCFVPTWLLVRTEISPSAKLLYLKLAQSVNSHGQALLNPEVTAWEIGENVENIFRLMNELESFVLIKTTRHPLKTEMVQAAFPAHPWRGGKEFGHEDNKEPSLKRDSEVPTLPATFATSTPFRSAAAQ